MRRSAQVELQELIKMRNNVKRYVDNKLAEGGEVNPILLNYSINLEKHPELLYIKDDASQVGS